MKRAGLLGVIAAVLAHAAFVLFGGLLFPRHEDEHDSLQEVDLLAADAGAPVEDEPEESEAKPADSAEMETRAEEIPDAAEILRELDAAPVVDTPALEAVSLGAIEAALGGQSAGGDFADALAFTSGGRIGGMGSAAALDSRLEDAFSLGEIDQKPRVVFQSMPLFPASMRGKKIEGVVTVRFVVDAAGGVTDPAVERSTHPAFERPALDAVRQWKFEPAVKGGQRVPCKMKIPIRFPPS
jgi:protein TonB